MWSFPTVVTGVLLLLSVAVADDAGRQDVAVTRPIVVELFTSQGCSSCPPADRLLSELSESQPVAGAQIIVLSQHVDYWNGLGWTDPFSAREFSERQARYATRFGNRSAYTPQMVVDGQAEFVGHRRDEALRAIAEAAGAPKAVVTLSAGAPRGERIVDLEVRVGELPGLATRARVLLAITEDDLGADVTRGENAGRRLDHAGVVRELQVLGRIDADSPAQVEFRPTLTLQRSWIRANLRAVVLVQAEPAGRILGAGSLPLGPGS